MKTVDDIPRIIIGIQVDRGLLIPFGIQVVLILIVEEPFRGIHKDEKRRKDGSIGVKIVGLGGRKV